MEKLLLCPDTAVSPEITLSENASCSEMIWETGHSIDTNSYDLSNLEFICETLPAGKLTDYMLSDFGCPVISPRLRTLLEQNGIDNIQYFPATIQSTPKTATAQYYAANILGLVACIDTDQSVMDAETDENGETTIIYSIDKLVLKKTSLDPGSIFIAFPFERIILIDERFSKLFDDAGIFGVKCIDPDRWDGINGEI